MKNVLAMVRIVFTTLVVSIFLLIWWSIYTNGNFGFGGETPPREDRPSMQEVTSLLDEVTKGLPVPDRYDERSKVVVRSAVKVYINPTQQMTNRLMQNIADQTIWEEVPIEIYADEYNKHKYCYNQYGLTTVELGRWFPDTTTKRELHVSMGWSDSSPCRKAYLESLDANIF